MLSLSVVQCVIVQWLDKILKKTPFPLDVETEVGKPFSLNDWLIKNPTANEMNLFEVNDQFDIKVNLTYSSYSYVHNNTAIRMIRLRLTS